MCNGVTRRQAKNNVKEKTLGQIGIPYLGTFKKINLDIIQSRQIITVSTYFKYTDNDLGLLR